MHNPDALNLNLLSEPLVKHAGSWGDGVDRY